MKLALSGMALLAAFTLPTSAAEHWSAVASPGGFDSIELFLPGADGLYAGSTMGQVFRSADHGATWTPVGSGLPEEYAPVNSMVFSDSWLIIARSGFGEFNYRSRLENGAWSSWEPLPYQASGIRSFTSIGSIVFALLSDGVNRSDDHGLTWIPVTQPGATGKLFTHEGRLFATTQSLEGSLYRSEDLGQTWTSIGGALGSAYVCSHAYWQTQLLVSVYHMGGIGSVWSSEDFGTTWDHVTTLPTDTNMNGMAIGGDGRLAIGSSGADEDGQSVWRSGDLVEWEGITGDLPGFARPFNDLVYHDGWYFKTGGSVTAYRAQDSATSAVEPIALGYVAFGINPNPIRGLADFCYEIPAASTVSLEVFDASGRCVTRSFLGTLAAGIHHMAWEARDDSGRPLPGGIYFARLGLDSTSRTSRLTVLGQ